MLRVRPEARAKQRRIIRQNAHNLNKLWLNAMGDKALKSGMMYFEVACPRSDSWRVGMCCRDEIVVNRFLVNNLLLWAVSFQQFPKPNLTFHSGQGQHITLSNQRLNRIGVLADYERGEISFYHCGSGFKGEERRLIYSVKTFFQGQEIFPLVSIKDGKVQVVPFQEPPFTQ